MNAPLLPSLAIAGLVVGFGASLTAAAAEGEERVTRSAEGFAADHRADELRDPTWFELDRRAATDVTVKPRSGGSSKGFAGVQAFGDSYVYEATTELFTDRDADGYYTYLRVRFDADTVYTRSWIYAEIYLSADGTAWERLYTTNDFDIFGSDPDDDYEVETELVSGYSTALYDVLIEIYDADTGELVDEFGPNESPEFSLLPLEDSGRDGAVFVPAPESHSHGGGGALSWLGVLGLLGALKLRYRGRALPHRCDVRRSA
jgi:hypothetical protein